MLSELRNNANSDKEFMQNELRRKIKELEQELADLRKANEAQVETLKE